MLGEIPRTKGRRGSEVAHPLVVREAPRSPAAEGFRTLRTSIESLVLDRRFKYIQITSSQVDDGKAVILANLALALARSGVEVSVVCCDLRNPLTHEVLGVSNKAGFTNVALGTATVTDVLQRSKEEPNLAVIAPGPPVPSPSELLTSDRVSRVISAIKPRTSSPTAGPSLILVDSAPVLSAVDSLIVSRAVDATLLVASANASVAAGPPAVGADAPAQQRPADRHRALQRRIATRRSPIGFNGEQIRPHFPMLRAVVGRVNGPVGRLPPTAPSATIAA